MRFLHYTRLNIMQLLYALNTRSLLFAIHLPVRFFSVIFLPDKNVCVGTASLTSAGLKQGCFAQRKRPMVSVR